MRITMVHEIRKKTFDMKNEEKSVCLQLTLTLQLCCTVFAESTFLIRTVCGYENWRIQELSFLIITKPFSPINKGLSPY